MKIEVRRDRPSAAAIGDQLQRILASTPFARAERMRRFLEYTIEQKLSGQASSLKEYSIALKVYDKPASFDPRLDPIILGGHLKTGHSWPPENRPLTTTRGTEVFTLLPTGEASTFSVV